MGLETDREKSKIMKRDEISVIQERALKVGFNKIQFEKEASFALQIWNDPKNRYLQKASKESFLSAILNVAQIGLTLNPVAKEAYIIPRYDRNSSGVIACLEPSYIGLVKLLTDAGSVKHIKTNVVYHGDEIEMDLSLKDPIQKHIPYIVNGNKKGDIIFVYSKATLHDGSIMVEYMSKAEIDEIREISESYKAFKDGKAKSSIWVTWEAEMCRKTVLKRLTKYLPKTEQHQYIDNAIQLTNNEFEATNTQIGVIESLLQTSGILESQKEEIEKSLPALNWHEANKTISYLKGNQLNPIESGNGYGAKDIHRQLDSKMLNERQ